MNNMETHMFLMPNYYMDFSCKMGRCRSACCVGWPISISMKNYFYLLGLDCNEDLRHRLDCGVRVIDRPTEEEYARFEPRYDGNCPLRMPDGRCALHAELGEEILPDVCRLYPRGIRAEDGLYECSCANSCEAVLELFLKQEEPITFVHRKLTLLMPPMSERKSMFETLGLEQDIRLHLISVMQNRAMTIPERLICMGQVLDKMDVVLANRDKAGLDSLLQQMPMLRIAIKEDIDQDHLSFGLKIAEKMMEILDERSHSIRMYGEEALRYFGTNDDAPERYRIAKVHFETTFPHWEIFFEHMLVNHMFFSTFPFQDRPESMHSEHVALCAIYALMRFLALGVMVSREGVDELTDVMASAFRLIDHTEFDRLSSHLLQRLNYTSSTQLRDLVSL